MNKAEALGTSQGKEAPASEIQHASLSLSRYVEQRIRHNGPIPFSEYMGIALHGVNQNGVRIPGYYSQANVVIGDREGVIKSGDVDFYTSPEYSPLFGVLISSQILAMYDALGKPDDFRVVEMGGGNGTLANDIIHGMSYYAKKAGREIPHIRYVLVERSDTLSRCQRERLTVNQDLPVDVVQGSAESLPLRGATGVVISNELPDTFPIEIVRKKEDAIEQLFVGSGDSNSFEKVWNKPSPDVTDFIKRYDLSIPDDGSPYSCNLNMINWVNGVSQMLHKGFVITIDYDDFSSQSQDPSNQNSDLPIRMYGAKINGDNASGKLFVKQPLGHNDITTGIDFHVLARAGEEAGLTTEGFTTQKGFLFSLGYYGMKIDIHRGFGRCVGDRKLGTLFNVEGYLLEPQFKVLVQSKGVDSDHKLKGFDWTYTSPRDKEYFNPLPGQKVTIWKE